MLTMQSTRFAVAVLAAALSLLAASEQSAPAQADWINALRQGGYVIVFRHGASRQDQADTDPLNPSNVSQQRQLTDAGRAKAKEIGEAFRKLRIPVGQVQTSVFNRAVETGSLMNLGQVTSSLDLTDHVPRGYRPVHGASPADLAAALANADGLINTTPIGMAKYPGMPLSASLLRPDLWVAEIIYFPIETELLRAARALGCRTLDGGGMAVFQAAEAFRLFTGIQPDAQRMLQHFAALSAK